MTFMAPRIARDAAPVLASATCFSPARSIIPDTRLARSSVYTAADALAREMPTFIIVWSTRLVARLLAWINTNYARPPFCKPQIKIADGKE
jgi:hypothetical protein